MADISNAEKIYGPSMVSLKGKSTRIKTSPVMKYEIQIPRKIYKNNKNIEFCFDFIYKNGVAFMVSIDRKSK